MEENVNKTEEAHSTEQQKKSFFHFGKKETQQPIKKEVPQIKLVFQVEDAELSLQSVVDYANSRFLGEENVVEVIVVDESADERLLTVVRKAVTVNVEDTLSVIYLMDRVENRVSQITCLCVKGFSEDLDKELQQNNHVIRITKIV